MPGRANRRIYRPVDYSAQRNELVRLTKYLSTGNFKKLGSAPAPTAGQLRKRILISVLALVIFLIGLGFIIL